MVKGALLPNRLPKPAGKYDFVITKSFSSSDTNWNLTLLTLIDSQVCWYSFCLNRLPPKQE